MSAPYKGLTWDHPRGANTLIAAVDAWPGASNQPLIEWSTHPLEGFESHPISELCAHNDLIVLDHPHIGEAISHNCLQPLDQIFDPLDLATLQADTIGPCFSSYNMSGRQWALPLDAATQVMAYREDLLTCEPPKSWQEVERLSTSTGRVALSLAGPHAFLTLLSIATALEPETDLRNGDEWFGHASICEAYGLLKRLAIKSPAKTLSLNPIGILEAMTTGEDVVLCPLIYGYVNYAGNGRIRYRDAPSLRSGGMPGSILGGTGIGISNRCAVTNDLKDHLLWLMSPSTQRRFIPDHDGQPSNRTAWRDPGINDIWGDFYSATMTTIEAARIRPRHDGYITLQTRASTYLRNAVSTDVPPDRAARALSDMLAHSKSVVEEV
ncbi:MAG: carbohydrate ABC transporter substrate-binding protein [Alphaproteobacteria bacterium]|nr:carbohydrate ABC transporter substrate-binding protein [Alphaproteobacteria bacterium]